MESHSTPEVLSHFHFAEHDTLTLHTQNAIRYFNGDWKTGRVYLIQFARLMNHLWEATTNDDPYAEHTLAQTYEGIKKAQLSFREALEKIQKQFTVLNGFEVRLYTNAQPLKPTLNFKTPLAFMGAILLRDVDYLLRQLLTLRKFGIFEPEGYSHKDILSTLARTYALPRTWRMTGVTRADILQQTEVAIKAKTLMGEIPITVLAKQLDLPFIPHPYQNHPATD